MPSPRATHARKLDPQGTGTSPSLCVRWTPEQLSRLLSIARQAEGEIAGLPAASWWPAFLLTILDTALSQKALLAVAMEDYRQRSVAVGLITYELHPHAVAAIENLSHRARLFPWPWSAATLNNRFRHLIALAGIPTPEFAFNTLRETARSELDLLDRLDLTTDFTPVEPPESALPPDEPLEEELADPNTVVGYAQRYPDLRLELRDTTAYLYVTVAKMFERFHKRPIFLTELSTELLLKWLKAFVASGRAPTTANSPDNHPDAVEHGPREGTRPADPQEVRSPQVQSASEVARLVATRATPEALGSL